eukprot:7998917-Alexandrium_andersonii.AAC.2
MRRPISVGTPKPCAPSRTSSSPARNRRRRVALRCAASTGPCWEPSLISPSPGWTSPCSRPLFRGGAARRRSRTRSASTRSHIGPRTTPNNFTTKRIPGGSHETDSGRHLRIFSDAAFKKEESTGHCVGGAVYYLRAGSKDSDFAKTSPCHVLDFVSRQQRREVRATCSA